MQCLGKGQALRVYIYIYIYARYHCMFIWIYVYVCVCANVCIPMDRLQDDCDTIFNIYYISGSLISNHRCSSLVVQYGRGSDFKNWKDLGRQNQSRRPKPTSASCCSALWKSLSCWSLSSWMQRSIILTVAVQDLIKTWGMNSTNHSNIWRFSKTTYLTMDDCLLRYVALTKLRSPNSGPLTTLIWVMRIYWH